MSGEEEVQSRLDTVAELNGYSKSCPECDGENTSSGSDLYYDSEEESTVLISGILCDECESFSYSEFRPLEVERHGPVEKGGLHG